MEDGHGNSATRYTDVPSDSHCYPYNTQVSTDFPDIDFGAFLPGDSGWIIRDELDPETLDANVEEACGTEQQLHEAHVGYKEARDALHQVRRGHDFWRVVALPSGDMTDPFKQRLEPVRWIRSLAISLPEKCTFQSLLQACRVLKPAC